MSQPPFFHEASGAVRFWVLIEGNLMGASISKETLHYRYSPNTQNDNPLATYTAHSQDIDDAVRRRVARGSIEPVMVRESDLRVAAA